MPREREVVSINRHCERSEAIHLAERRKNGLLRFARNDVERVYFCSATGAASAGAAGAGATGCTFFIPKRDISPERRLMTSAGIVARPSSAAARAATPGIACGVPATGAAVDGAAFALGDGGVEFGAGFAAAGCGCITRVTTFSRTS